MPWKTKTLRLSARNQTRLENLRLTKSKYIYIYGQIHSDCFVYGGCGTARCDDAVKNRRCNYIVRIGRFHSPTKAGMQQRNENMFLMKKSCDGSRKVGHDWQNRKFPKRKTQNLPFKGNHRFAMIGPAAPIFKVMKFEIQHAVESKVHLAIGHWLAEGRRKPRFFVVAKTDRQHVKHVAHQI